MAEEKTTVLEFPVTNPPADAPRPDQMEAYHDPKPGGLNVTERPVRSEKRDQQAEAYAQTREEKFGVPNDDAEYDQMVKSLERTTEPLDEVAELEGTYDLPADALPAVQEVFEQSKKEDTTLTKLAKWFTRTLKWGKTEKDGPASHKTIGKDAARYGRSSEAPDDQAILVQTYPKDDFVPYSALSNALNQDSPPVQVFGTQEYAFILERTDKTKIPFEDRSVDQIGAVMGITRAGRSSKLKEQYPDRKYIEEDHSASKRMQDAENAGFKIYRAKLENGNIPPNSEFKQITMLRKKEDAPLAEVIPLRKEVPPGEQAA